MILTGSSQLLVESMGTNTRRSSRKLCLAKVHPMLFFPQCCKLINSPWTPWLIIVINKVKNLEGKPNGLIFHGHGAEGESA